MAVNYFSPLERRVVYINRLNLANNGTCRDDFTKLTTVTQLLSIARVQGIFVFVISIYYPETIRNIIIPLRE